MCEQWVRSRRVARPPLEHDRSTAVELASLLRRDDGVRRLAQFVVDEAEPPAGGLLEHAPLDELLDRDRPVDVFAHEREEKLGIELAAEAGGHLDEGCRRRGKVSETALQELLERAGQWEPIERRIGARLSPPSGPITNEQTLVHGGAQILGDEEGDPLGLPRHDTEKVGRRPRQCEHVAHHRPDALPGQPVERDGMRPRRVNDVEETVACLVAPIDPDDEDRVRREEVRRERLQEAERELVCPLEIVEHQEHGALLGERGHGLAQDGEDAVTRTGPRERDRIGVERLARHRGQGGLVDRQHRAARAE